MAKCDDLGQIAFLRLQGQDELADLFESLAARPDAETLALARQKALEFYRPLLLTVGTSFSGRKRAPELDGPEVVAKETEGLTGVFFHAAAAAENFLRNAALDLKLLFGAKGPIFVAEGDSWFCFPLVEPTDLAKHLAGDHLVYSLARPGDLFVDYLKPAQFDETSDIIERYGASALLLSGGGNEIIGENFGTHLDAGIGGYSVQSITDTASGIADVILDLVDRMAARHPHLKIFAHSYDWPVPREPGGWLRGPLEDAQIPPTEWNAVVRGIIDRFAAALDRVEAKRKGVFFHADLRGSGQQLAANWHDEIHLNSAAAGLASQRFANRILTALAGA